MTARASVVDLVARHLGGHVGLEDAQLGSFFVDEVLATGLLELVDALFALFDLLADDREDASFVKRFHGRNLGVLDGGDDHADGDFAPLVVCAHGVFEVFGELFFKGHS